MNNLILADLERRAYVENNSELLKVIHLAQDSIEEAKNTQYTSSLEDEIASLEEENDSLNVEITELEKEIYTLKEQLENE